MTIVTGILRLFSPAYAGLALGGGLFFLSLLFNTSFHIMGVDIGEFIGMFLGDFAGIILVSYGKILLLNLVFWGSLGYLIHIDARNYNGSHRFEWVVFGIIIFLCFLHSVVRYPQIYGEFFYIRYPKLIGILHFLTDYLPPLFPLTILWGGMLAMVGHTLFKALETQDRDACFLVVAWFVFFLIHYYGSYVFLVLYFLALPYTKRAWKKVRWQGFLGTMGFIAFIAIFPLLWENFYFLTNRYLIGSKDRENHLPNIFILSADSLRLDRLGFVSGNPAITPAIDSFVKDSVVFRDHHVTIPRTFPSWADLLTGEFSMAHGIRDMFPSPEEKKNIGNTRFPTLPQILAKKGYKSAVVGNFAADIFPRANFGFGEVHTPKFNAKVLTVQRGLDSQIFLLPILTGSFLFGGEYISEVDGLSTLGDGSRLLPRFRSVIRRNSESPLFLVNFSSVVHFPYTPPYPYYKKFTDPNYYGRYKYLKFVDPSADEKPTEKDVEEIRSLFDSAIHAYDHEFSAMIRILKFYGLYDESIVILTADHGEALYESIHGQGHGEHLRGENVTKVPLVVKFPKSWGGLAGREISAPTSSIDILPTLLSAVGMQADAQTKPGISWLELLEDESTSLPIGYRTFEKNNSLGKTEISQPQKVREAFRSVQDRGVYSETGIWFSDRGNQFFQKQRIPYPNILLLHKVVPEEDYEIMITDRQYRETIAFSKHRAYQTTRYKLIYIPTREGVVYELYDRLKDPDNTQNLWNTPLRHSVGEKLKKELLELIQKNSRVKIVGEYLLPLDLP